MTVIPLPLWQPALLGTALPDGRVRCELCPHECVLAPGESGRCAVRRNDGGVLRTAAGSPAVAHLDAIERKPFYHAWPGRKVLTVAGPGCSFRCNYCLNYRLSQFGRDPAVPWTGSAAEPAAIVARADRERAAIGLSYSEPSLAVELTLELADRAAPHDLPILWKSNGFLTAAGADLVAPVLAAVNIDVKAATDAAHRRLTGAPLGPVLDTVRRLRAAGVWVEISTPLIPGISDRESDLRAIAGRLAEIDQTMPWHLLRFTPEYRMLRQDPTAPESLRRAREIGREAGLRFVYVERALGPEGRNTRCPGCDRELIARGLWETLSVTLAGGACPHCRASIPGRW
ncbi:radical SAM protein [Actinoplanes oblitus]|uniref:Radical SAM protein n=1 Tax=Actinoplanes oblitus TaxID=3040509 RepID=A0ABY8WPR9_9ACTN|nr:radical SAM protein [Actinoplanes oblitus]WIM99422.1 radical SAM protein [Actinoplanes oblitus]